MDFYIIKGEFFFLESQLKNDEINFKEFIEGLGCFQVYVKEFYVFYFNIRVIEFGIKYFLGCVFCN